MTERKATNIVWHEGHVTRELRHELLRQKGCTVWLTGLSGSGKSTIAVALERALVAQGRAAYVLDGDNIRHGLNSNLGFSAADRTENIRRIAEVSKLFADAGLVSITSFISPYAADRDAARRVHASAGLPFYECFVNTPLDVCEGRDPKGLYKKARAGAIKEFTGLDAPYESPPNPDLELKTAHTGVGDCVAAILARLTSDGVLPS